MPMQPTRNPTIYTKSLQCVVTTAHFCTNTGQLVKMNKNAQQNVVVFYATVNLRVTKLVDAIDDIVTRLTSAKA
eukprot:c20937_g1_i1 orf=877-1098(-)